MARLPPRQISTRASPFTIAFMASTASCPWRSGGRKPKVFSKLSNITGSIFSVMPTLRLPCTLECPRNGQMPAPGLPKLPRISSNAAICCTFCVPRACWVIPMP
ncbi:hypothetical protein D3C73_996750 [compost metagenome]